MGTGVTVVREVEERRWTQQTGAVTPTTVATPGSRVMATASRRRATCTRCCTAAPRRTADAGTRKSPARGLGSTTGWRSSPCSARRTAPLGPATATARPPSASSATATPSPSTTSTTTSTPSACTDGYEFGRHRTVIANNYFYVLSIWIRHGCLLNHALVSCLCYTSFLLIMLTSYLKDQRGGEFSKMCAKY